MIENVDYFVRFADFPVCSCGGLVKMNEDGTFTILLNSRLSYDQNTNSLQHELNHIKNGDFYRDAPIDQIEKDAG